jgi:hypothetical protein
LIRLSAASGGTGPYVDGFETTNARIIGFQTGSPATFRRLRMHDLLVGGDGTNAAFIMTLTQTVPVVGMVIQDSEFHRASQACTIKIYAQEKLLIEDTVHYDAPVGIELKDDVRQYTVRSNRFNNISGHALGGNMHEVTTSGEIAFNTLLQPGADQIALDVNQDGMAGPTHIYRNTFVGRVRVRNTDSSDGPFYFSYNVIVNDDSGTPAGSHIYHESVSAPARVVITNNLVGYPSAGIVDATGMLTAGYASYIGTHGHQTVAGGATAPRAPVNVVIR